MRPIDSPNTGYTRLFTVEQGFLFAYDSEFTINDAIFVDAFSDLDTITRQNMDPAAYLKNFVPFML